MQRSLYNRWRPQTFQDLKGQDVIRDTIFYALQNGRMAQAYLFCGPRGTGKTSTARLIAKFINCAADGDTRPCNACAICKAITDGANFDVIELDAASNRGIDEIRQLRESVRFAPTQAKHKVFIIDEVHMLTREAFNALLKTLEEPPAHTVFILATTEAHKIPPTIISRCQRYDFRLATLDTLVAHLLDVAKKEGIVLTPEAAQFLARLGEGSFRDSLSLLEQVRAANHPEYTLAVVEGLFGYIPRESVAACLGAVLDGRPADAHAVIDAALAQGADLRAFCDQLLHLSRECLESLALGDVSGLPESLVAPCQQAGLSRVIAWLELLLAAVHQMKQSPIARLPLDIAVAKMARGQGAGGRSQGVGVRKQESGSREQEEKQVVPQEAEGGKKAPPMVAATIPVVAVPESPSLNPEPVAVHETVAVPVAVTVPDAISAEQWQQILTELKKETPSLVTSLAQGQVQGVEGDVVKIAVRYKMHADKINQVKNRAILEQVLQTVLALPLKVEAIVVKDLPEEEDEAVDLSQVFEFEEA